MFDCTCCSMSAFTNPERTGTGTTVLWRWKVELVCKPEFSRWTLLLLQKINTDSNTAASYGNRDTDPEHFSNVRHFFFILISRCFGSQSSMKPVLGPAPGEASALAARSSCFSASGRSTLLSLHFLFDCSCFLDPSTVNTQSPLTSSFRRFDHVVSRLISLFACLLLSTKNTFIWWKVLIRAV